jgi:hypothetical protein
VALSSNSAVGGDMANTLAFNDMAQNMQALALPLQEIET